ncbi:hypothetical protein pb186bvf_018032 [Paramecium bursaria]
MNSKIFPSSDHEDEIDELRDYKSLFVYAMKVKQIVDEDKQFSSASFIVEGSFADAHQSATVFSQILQSQFQRHGKRSLFNAKQFETPKHKLKRNLNKLRIILGFFRTLKFIQLQQTPVENKVQIRRDALPFYPDDKIITWWIKLIELITFLAILVYPNYISYDNVFLSFIIRIRQRLSQTFQIFVFFQILFYLSSLVKQIKITISLRIGRVIALYNLQSWTIPDLLSILPYNQLGDNDRLLGYISFLKLIRIIKYFFFSRKKFFMQLTEQTKGENYMQWIEEIKNIFGHQFMTVLNIYIDMLILVNLFGCLWDFLTIQQDRLEQSEYINSIYWAMQTVCVVGYGDMYKADSLYYCLTIIWMMVGVGFYSFTIGNLANILSQLNQKEEFESEIDILEELFNVVDVPDLIQDQVADFFFYNLQNNPYWIYKKILQSVPQHLTKEIIAFCSQQLLKNINFFQIDINFSATIMTYFNLTFYKRYETIYSIGSASLEVFFLVTGEVRLTDINGNSLFSIHEGFMFGELEFFENQNRLYHCFASADSIVLVCPARIFFSLIAKNPALAYELDQLSSRRIKMIKELIQMVKKKPRISRLSVYDESNPLPKKLNQLITKKQQNEKAFKETVDKRPYNQIQKMILSQIVGQKNERRLRLQAQFRIVIYRVLNYVRQHEDQVLLSRRHNQLLGQKDKQEKRMIRKINKRQSLIKYFQPMNDILQKQSYGMFKIKLSPQTQKVIQEQKLEKERKKKHDQDQQVFSQRLLKLDLSSRLQIVESFTNSNIHQNGLF